MKIKYKYTKTVLRFYVKNSKSAFTAIILHFAEVRKMLKHKNIIKLVCHKFKSNFIKNHINAIIYLRLCG